jgi:hypothetical protein
MLARADQTVKTRLPNRPPGTRRATTITWRLSTMGIGISVFLLAVGAILTFAIDVTTEGVNLDTVGVILMVVGALGLLMSMLFWSSFAPFGTAGHTETYVRDDRRF